MRFLTNTTAIIVALSLIGGSILLTSQTSEAQGGRGFVTHDGNQFVWSGTGEAFVPNLWMHSGYIIEGSICSSDAEKDRAISQAMDEHGFNGLHVGLLGQWFNCGTEQVSGADTTVDMNTIEHLRTLIQKVYAKGGMVHIWAWGDSSRRQTSAELPGGIMGPEERRVWDVVYEELNDVPGWTVGYGYDLVEWVSDSELTEWVNYLESKPGWNHLTSARNSVKEPGSGGWLDQRISATHIASLEAHQPTYDHAVEALNRFTSKPVMFEDRFRIGLSGTFSWSQESTRLGLWRFTMAGGVAAIWGNMSNSPQVSSYPNSEELRTFRAFWNGRYLRGMEPDNSITDGYGLRRGDEYYVFYKENTDQISYTIAGGDKEVVAINTRAGYQEIPIGIQAAGEHVFEGGSTSDWAIAVGDFDAPGAVTPGNFGPGAGGVPGGGTVGGGAAPVADIIDREIERLVEETVSEDQGYEIDEGQVENMCASSATIITELSILRQSVASATTYEELEPHMSRFYTIETHDGEDLATAQSMTGFERERQALLGRIDFARTLDTEGEYTETLTTLEEVAEDATTYNQLARANEAVDVILIDLGLEEGFALPGGAIVGGGAGGITPGGGVANPGGVPLIIFDSDYAPDIDDLIAHAILFHLERMGEARVIGGIVSTSCNTAAGAMERVNNWHNRDSLDIGTWKGYSVWPDCGRSSDGGDWATAVYNRYPGDVGDSSGVPGGVMKYREWLSASPDNSVRIVTVGMLSVLGALLDSGGDSIDPRSGIELVQQKVQGIYVMGGRNSGQEFNLRHAIPGTASVVSKSPVPVYWSYSNIGGPVRTGRTAPQQPENNLIRYALEVFNFQGSGTGNGRETWDGMNVLAAVRRENGGFRFERGTMTFNNGANSFESSASGRDYLVYKTQSDSWYEELLEPMVFYNP